jgi:hypothetical protein
MDALGEVFVGESLGAFKFDNEKTFYEEVRVIVPYAFSFVMDGERGL